MQNPPVRRSVTGAAIVLIALSCDIAVAQSPRASQSHASPEFASPLLPRDHWAVATARRAASLGLAPEQLGWLDGTVSQASAGWAIHSAAESASTSGTALGDVFMDAWQRFAREFPAVAHHLETGLPDDDHADAAVAAGSRDGRRRIAPAIDRSVELGLVANEGRLAPVRSLDRTRENVSPPTPLTNLRDADLRVAASVSAGRHLATAISAGRGDGEWRVHEWQLVSTFGPLRAWAGKRAPGFGPSAGGGLVFDGRAMFTAVGAGLNTPVRLPWVLRHLGFVNGEAFLSRVDSNAATRHPWVFGSHLSLTPHPRLEVGATQGFMFSGEGLPPFTWRNFKEMFLTHGIRVAGREFENGIAALEARWRPPLPLPTVLYLQWGADDNHSALFRFPAVVAGATVPSLPFAPRLALGLERTSFARPCSGCGGCACEYYATWYRHYVFLDGWTVDREPIGHSLGGDGTEWLLYGRFDDARGVRIDGRGFVRRRGRYNLTAPTHQGGSVGAMFTVDYGVTRTLDLRIDAAVERGARDWTTSSLATGVRWWP